jgi:lysophospholipase L1-like esterase
MATKKHKNILYLLCFLCFCAALIVFLINSEFFKGEKPRHFRIVTFGDSTTAVRGDVRKVYAQRLAEILSKVKSEIKFEMINAGVSGHNTNHGRARFDRDVLNKKPALVIIQFGLNDSCIDVHRGKTGPRVPQAVYEQNLVYFIQSLRERKSRVILMTPNPARWTEQLKATWGRPPYDTNDPMGFNLLNRRYAESVRRIAQEMDVPLVDVYQLFVNYHQKDGCSMDDLLLDGIHPNDRGHRLITGAILRLLPLTINN